MKNQKEVYLVELGIDYIDEFYKYIEFATLDKKVAEKYVEKYNRVVGRIREFYNTKYHESESDGTEEDLIWWEKNYEWSQKMDAKIITKKLR